MAGLRCLSRTQISRFAGLSSIENNRAAERLYGVAARFSISNPARTSGKHGLIF
jgi:hypothetical protein